MSLPTRPVAAPSTASGLLVTGLVLAWVDLRLGGLSALGELALTVVVVLCAVVAQAAVARGDLELARRFRLLARWGALTDGVPALLGLTVLVLTGEAGRDAGVLAPLVIVLVVAGLAYSVWLLLSLWQLRSWGLLTRGVPALPRLL
jgi:hypothetical protein